MYVGQAAPPVANIGACLDGLSGPVLRMMSGLRTQYGVQHHLILGRVLPSGKSVVLDILITDQPHWLLVNSRLGKFAAVDNRLLADFLLRSSFICS